MFYQALNELSEIELSEINMTSVARTNDLLWNPELLTLQRQHARFVNTAMMATLGGAIVSDGLNNLQEVSGVGGQFDFVEMAQKLENARSIINCHSVRKTKNKIKSNIVSQYPNMTIPRHMRDIVVTEYGIADCRSKTDEEIIKTILNVTDSRFQEGLLKQAKRFGKIKKDYQIPEIFKNNYPEKNASIIKEFQEKKFFKPYPFGSDLTDEEMVLAKALLKFKKSSKLKQFGIIITALFSFKNDKPYQSCLKRMQLEHPQNLKEFFYKRLLKQII